MAKLSFVFANGTLTATGANTFIHVSSGDYVAKTIGDGGDIEVYPFNNDPRLKIFKFHYDGLTLDIGEGDTDPTSAAQFVADFNHAAGTQFGYNTQYPQYLFSQHIDLDTSHAEQVVPVPVITGHLGGYVTLTTSEDNAGDIYIGESDVDDTNYHLEAGKSITLELCDLSSVWVMCETPNDSIEVIGAFKN
jgi:hypothetical protein